MSNQKRAFRPLAPTQNIAVTTVAQTVNLNYALGTVSIRIVNVGTQTVFFLSSDTTPVTDATVANAIPIPAGQTEIFTLPTNTTAYSVVAGALGSMVYTTIGEGM